MKLLFALIFIGVAFASDDANCPAFSPFNEYTNECIWYPLSNMRKKISEHCQLPPPPGGFPEGTMIPFPTGESMPTTPCGNCGYKMRCQKRTGVQDGCFLLNAEKKTCTEADGTGFGAVCDLPKTVRGDCYWGQYLEGLKQCLNANPALPMWRRQGYQKMLKIMPSGHCVEVNGRCKCCCDPYWPSEDGASCVQKEPDTCAAFGDWNGWSQCLWYPESSLIQGIRDHCQLTGGPSKIPFPEVTDGVTIPEKCGWCSFKLRCKKREESEGCFGVRMDKKNCGPDDCPDCGKPCQMPKVTDGTCDWQNQLSARVKNAIVQMQKVLEAQGKKVPRWKKEGYLRLLSMMPFGKCVEKDGQCHCCCHPFEPKEENGAITCQVKANCNGPWMRAPPS